MKISFYEKIQIAIHIERKVSKMKIPSEELELKVYEDIGSQIKREYGLDSMDLNIDEKYLADIHDFIDCYELPRILEDRILDENEKRNND